MTKTELNSKGYLTEHQDLSQYVSLTYLQSNYITSETLDNSLDLYIPTSWINDYNDYVNINAYLDSKGYLTEHQDLGNYITNDELKNKNYVTNDKLTSVLDSYVLITTLNNVLDNYALSSSLDKYVTNDELKNKHYLTEHQDLSDYVTNDELEDKHYLTEHQDLTTIQNLLTIIQSILDGYIIDDQKRNSYVTIKSDIEKLNETILSLSRTSKLSFLSTETGNNNIIYVICGFVILFIFTVILNICIYKILNKKYDSIIDNTKMISKEYVTYTTSTPPETEVIKEENMTVEDIPIPYKKDIVANVKIKKPKKKIIQQSADSEELTPYEKELYSIIQEKDADINLYSEYDESYDESYEDRSDMS